MTDSSMGVVVGVDTHKYLHVAVALSLTGERLGALTIPTDTGGYEELAAPRRRHQDPRQDPRRADCAGGARATRRVRNRPRRRGGDADPRRRQTTRAAALRSRVRESLRRLPDPSLLRHDRAPPPELRGASSSQQRALPHRHRAHALPSRDDRLRRSSHRRRKDQARDHSLPQALRRPSDLPLPDHAANARPDTHNVSLRAGHRPLGRHPFKTPRTAT